LRGHVKNIDLIVLVHGILSQPCLYYCLVVWFNYCKFVQVNDGRLRTAGEASQRSTREDWAEWMRHLSIELLKESPSPALRTCARLAQLQVWTIALLMNLPLLFPF
jgi:hypothetical protein